MSLQLQNILFLTALVGFALMEWITRRYKNTVTATANDTKLEIFMAVSLIVFTQPLVILMAGKLCTWLIPEMRNTWSGMAWWAMAGILLIGDDLTQYWWHRISHSPLMWPLHRAHHSASYMSIRITYRNNFFYYLMMPGIWFSGVAIFLGMGQVFLFYILVKLTVILGAHCAWRWDEPLYKIKALHPVMWVIERTISTPATHWAHHAITNEDGIGNYSGNFGNLLFFWDVLFGSAHITRQYPTQIGLIDDRLFGQERWYHQMFYPVLQSRRAHTALKHGGKAYVADTPASSLAGTTAV